MSLPNYSTALKISFALGLEKQFVENEVRAQIPSSTINYWKNNVNSTEIIGYELEDKINANLNDIKLMYHPALSASKDCFIIYSKLIVLLVSLFEKKVFQKTIRNHKAKIIEFLSQYSEYISYKKMSELIGVSDKTLYDWKNQVTFKCSLSPINLCAKRHPNQATKQEVNVVQTFLKDVKYAHWGIQNIWAKAFKEGFTKLSKYSWYRYNNLLGIRKSYKKGKKPTYNPIIASKVNEVWHADITVFKTLDGIRHYIYTVMDNYSRYILSWRIETVVSAEIRLETIKDAIQNAFDGKLPKEQIQFITDGGPENDNMTLKEFMRENQAFIKHDIALKDIVQSNSMAEAFYSTVKYRYLYLQQIHNGDELLAAFKALLQEYQFEKPHYALGIYTPSEVLNGQNPKEKFTDVYKEAAKERRKINQLGCEVDCN